LAESIRGRLVRETRVYLGLAAAGWLSFVACLFVPRPPAWLMIGAFVATCGGLLSLLVFVRCPRCRAHLPQIGFTSVLAPASAARHTHCPGCGATLD
jgi:hypothetical protein